MSFLLQREDESKRDLPPRTHNPQIIASVLKEKPIKIKSGFCAMCDSSIYEEWVLNEKNRDYELRHLADIGALRYSEVGILIHALETEKLKNHWNKHLNIIVFLSKTIKIFKIVILKIKKLLWSFCIFLGRQQWRVSKNNNLYSPMFRATIYPWNRTYNIARYGIHYKGFYSIEDAMDATFKVWLKNTLFWYICFPLFICFLTYIAYIFKII